MLAIQPYLDIIIAMWPERYQIGSRYLVLLPREQYVRLQKVYFDYIIGTGILTDTKLTVDASGIKGFKVMTPIGMELWIKPATRNGVTIEPMEEVTPAIPLLKHLGYGD